jgi:small-conductance mechanosensitive channel
VALFMALLGTIGRLQDFTLGIAYVFIILWIIQSFYLLPQLMGSIERSFLYALTPFLLIECARIWIPLSSVLERELFVLNILVALVTLIWVARPSRMRRLSLPGRASFLFVVLVRSEFALLAASLLSNVFGFISLSQVLGMSAFFGLFAAGILYGGVRVLKLLLMILLRTDLAQSILEKSTGTVERWASRILVLGAALVWLQGMLRIFTVYDAFLRIGSRILQYSVGYGNVHFTLGSVLSVLLTLPIGYAIASALTLTLGNFLLPKLHLNRGVPYAISKVTYYVLLLLVATIALEGAGVELNKFTVLTGTLGVGLGFGLQNIVSNFVSGLILLFERPIHIGDTVDVGELVGTVRRIGARSSTVLTFQGAEVIVPNSNLISNQVINWTLSSPWRLVDVPVGVAYGTDPERVLKLLVDVANSHPGVLRVRPPTAFFLGFGESALNFELRFWAAQQEMWFQLRSDVTVDVSKALRQAGIEIPYPQRDLHLRSIDVSVGETLTDNGLRIPSSAHPSGSERSHATPQNPSRPYSHG